MKQEWVVEQYIPKVENTKKQKSIEKGYYRNEKTRCSANASHVLLDTDEVMIRIIFVRHMVGHLSL